MLLSRHAELDSASSYLVMLNLFQHLKVSLSYFVMLNSIQHLKHETLKQVQGDVEMVFRVTLHPVMLNLIQHLKKRP
jgi:hypothetical protein